MVKKLYLPASKVWRQSGEGPTMITEGQFSDGKETVFTSRDIRFTVKGSYLYATVLKWPESGKVYISSLGDKDASKLPLFHGIIKDVSVLGFDDAQIDWRRTSDALEIMTKGVTSEYPVVFKIKID